MQAGVSMPRPRERLFEFQGLADFLHFLDWACGLASTRGRLAELSYGFSKRLAEGGAGYADVIVNPTHWKAWHGRLPAMIDAIDAGFSTAVSLLRTQSSDAAAELVDTLIALRHPRVVALKFVPLQHSLQYKSGRACRQPRARPSYAIVIKLALPPAAAVFVLVARSTTSASIGNAG